MGSDDGRWGFEEAEDWEYDRPGPPPEEPLAADDQIIGQDPDAVVTVTVSPTADVLAVTLARTWKNSVDPRGLHASVLTAANTATIAALARQVEDVERTPPAIPTFGAEHADLTNETPLSTEDMLRLADAAMTELAQFTEQATAIVDRRITAESAGGHVHASMTNGQLVGVELDPSWAARVPSAEIESEIFDVLRHLHRVGSPPGLADGPQGPAIAEIMGLLFDPHRMARRVGLEPALGATLEKE